MPAPVIAAIIGAGATIGVAAAQHRAGRQAARRQTQSENAAADREMEMFQLAMEFQREQEQYNRDRAQATADARRPYLSLIEAALGSGGGAPSVGFTDYTPGEYTAADPFEAPDPNSITDDPAFQFRLQQGQQALERSASARGTLLTTGTLKDVLGYGQGLASQEYDKIYDRRYGEYALNEANRAAAFDRNESNRYRAADLNNRNALGLAGLQQSAYHQHLNSLLALAGLAVPEPYTGTIPGGGRPGGSYGRGGADVPPVIPAVGGGGGGGLPIDAPIPESGGLPPRVPWFSLAGGSADTMLGGMPLIRDRGVAYA